MESRSYKPKSKQNTPREYRLEEADGQVNVLTERGDRGVARW